MPTFGVGSFRIIVKRDHDADIVLSGMNEDQYPNRTFLSVLWKTKIILRIMKIFSQSILVLFLFCFVFFFNNNNNTLGSRKISNHLLIFWFPAMMLNSSNNFITLSQTKQISWESDQNPIGFTAEFDWLRKGCNHWTLNLNWFQSILQKKKQIQRHIDTYGAYFNHSLKTKKNIQPNFQWYRPEKCSC